MQNSKKSNNFRAQIFWFRHPWIGTTAPHLLARTSPKSAQLLIKETPRCNFLRIFYVSEKPTVRIHAPKFDQDLHWWTKPIGNSILDWSSLGLTSSMSRQLPKQVLIYLLPFMLEPIWDLSDFVSFVWTKFWMSSSILSEPKNNEKNQILYKNSILTYLNFCA